MVDIFSSKLAPALLAAWSAASPLLPGPLGSAAHLPEQVQTAFNNRAFGPKSTLPVVPLPSDEQLKDLERASYGGNVADIRTYQYALLRTNFPEFFVGDRAAFKIHVQGDPVDAASIARVLAEEALLQGKALSSDTLQQIGSSLSQSLSASDYSKPSKLLLRGLTTGHGYTDQPAFLNTLSLYAAPNPDPVIATQNAPKDPATCKDTERGNELFLALAQQYAAHHEVGHLIDFRTRAEATPGSLAPKNILHVNENVADSYAALMLLKTVGSVALDFLKVLPSSSFFGTGDTDAYTMRTFVSVGAWYQSHGNEAKLAQMSPREVYHQALRLMRPLPEQAYEDIEGNRGMSTTRKNAGLAVDGISTLLSHALYPPALREYDADKVQAGVDAALLVPGRLALPSRPIQPGPPFHPLEKMRESLFCNQPAPSGAKVQGP